MVLNNELEKKINEVFSKNIELRERLLALDPEAVIEIRTEGNSNFSSEDVIDCYETDSMGYLYKMAIKKKTYSQIYFEMIGNGKDPYFTPDESCKYDDTPMTKEELLKSDVETIKNIGIYGKSGISSQTVIDKYEKKENDKLYEIAKKKIMCTEAYFEYIGEKISGNGAK